MVATVYPAPGLTANNPSVEPLLTTDPPIAIIFPRPPDNPEPVCAIETPVVIPRVSIESAIEEVRPSVTLLDNVLIGFGFNSTISLLRPKAALMCI